MLSDIQAEIINRLSTAPAPVSLVEIGAWKLDAHGGRYGYGLDAARNCMKRLEKREFVVGTGEGRLRKYSVTPNGIAALGLPGEPEDEDEETPGRDWNRDYVVLEELRIDELEEDMFDGIEHVYVVRHRGRARNTDHAYRLTVAEAFPHSDLDVSLVAVPERSFQTKRIEVRNTRQVSVG